MKADKLLVTKGSTNTEDDNDAEKSIDNGESSKYDGERITFRNTPEFRRDFIDSCLEEVHSVGLNGSSLKMISWERIGIKLSAKYGCPLSQKKLRNHWDYLKKQYTAWSAIMSMPGHGYNAETNTFNCPQEQWDEISKKVKHSSQFKEKGLEDVELLKCLFEGKLIIGYTPRKPRKPKTVTLAQLAVASPVGSSSSEESEQPLNHANSQIMVVGDAQNTPFTRTRVKQKKRKRVETSSDDPVGDKVDYLVDVIDKHLQRKQITLDKQQIASEKQQIALEKHQITLDKEENLAASKFMKALENLKEAGHITFNDVAQVVLKASELTGWQKLFVSAPSVDYQVSFINTLLGR